MIASHEPWLLEYIPRSGRTAIDIGSARGVWTYTLAHRFSKVVAFDPIQWIPVLGVENVEFYNRALWSVSSRILITSYGKADWTSAVFGYGEYYDSAVPTSSFWFDAITLDSLGIKDVDFIKIDTEGSEYEVIKGALQTIRKYHPAMVIEIHKPEFGAAIASVLPEYSVKKIDHPNPDAKNFWIALNYRG